MIILPGVIELQLAFPPSANRYWRTGRNGVTFVSKEAIEYKKMTRALLSRERRTYPIFPEGPVYLLALCYMPSTNRDMGNTSKVLEDALEGVIYTNDIQICGDFYLRFEAEAPKRENAKVVVAVSNNLERIVKRLEEAIWKTKEPHPSSSQSNAPSIKSKRKIALATSTSRKGR